jgi:hypothetical protein
MIHAKSKIVLSLFVLSIPAACALKGGYYWGSRYLARQLFFSQVYHKYNVNYDALIKYEKKIEYNYDSKSWVMEFDTPNCNFVLKRGELMATPKPEQ